MCGIDVEDLSAAGVEEDDLKLPCECVCVYIHTCINICADGAQEDDGAET